MVVVGLTGGLGSGKSTVAARLAERGAVVVDADAIVREIQAPGGAAHAGIVERFGPGVVAGDGSIDRPALAAVVFADPAALDDLAALTHPLVARVIGERLAALSTTDEVVVLDIPLLAERGRDAYPVAGVLVVDCPVEVAVARVVAARGLSEESARARIAAQASREERLAIADFVVDNAGPPEDLDAQVDRAWAWIRSLRPAPAG